MGTLDRLYQYFEIKGIKPTRFEKDAGLSNGYLKTMHDRTAEVGTKILIKIINNCRDLSIEWLLTGEGGMFRPESNGHNATHCSNCANLERVIKAQEVTIQSLQKTIQQFEERLSADTSDGQKRKVL